MEITVKEIAAMIDADIVGSQTRVIRNVSSFDDAGAHDLTFASEPGFLKQVEQNTAGAVIVPKDFDVTGATGPVILKCDNPKLSFFEILSVFHPKKKETPFISTSAVMGINVSLGKDICIHPHVFIGEGATIGDRVRLHPNVYIGDFVRIDCDTTIMPNVTILEKTCIGKNVLIHSGSVIGSDGFGFAPRDNQHEKLVHTGFVQIGNRVEIGACNTIDRGTLGRTLIEDGVKTDNLIHIAHNVKIGKNTLIVAQAGIAGSTTIGDNVIIAGKAGISGHLTIGNQVIVGPNAGVVSDVDDNQVVSGYPHMPHRKWLKISALIPRLLDFRKKLGTLEKRISFLEKDGHRLEKK